MLIGMPDPSRPAVFARHAASLLVWQEGAAGPEVLMGQRGAGARFVPNRLVFPGGAVDPTDATSPVARAPRPDVLARLGRRPGLSRALIHAAARELEEEAGLSLGSPPALDAIDYICRAVTPPRQPIRFNARFFTVDAAMTTGTLRSSVELQDVRFLAVQEALTLDLMLVTSEVLRQFLAWHALPEAERRARTETPLFREKNWRRETLLR